MKVTAHQRYALVLFALWLLWEFVLAFDVYHRQTWAVENGLAVLGIGLLFVTGRYLPLSRISYTLIFVYACLHTLGAHFTYSEVPYREWWSAINGHEFTQGDEGQRNHYDRLIHFLYGLLLAYPIRECVLRVANVRGFWGYFLPLDVTMSTSMLYELIEWIYAEVVAQGDHHYLGTQGDEWDAHKDMLLATIGALIAMSVTAVVNAVYQRDFAREFRDSLRVKHADPLGEFALRKLKEHGTWEDTDAPNAEKSEEQVES